MPHDFIVPPRPKNQNQNPSNGLPNYSILNTHQYVIGVPKTPWTMYLKRFIKFSLLIFILGWVFFRYFGYWDTSNNCYINIYPSWMQFNNHTIIEGIRYLKVNHPYHYSELCTRIKNIDPNPVLGCGGIGGGCFMGATSKTIYIGTYPKEVLFSAAVIAHETCHQRQYDENRTMDEKECYDITNAIAGTNMTPP